MTPYCQECGAYAYPLDIADAHDHEQGCSRRYSGSLAAALGPAVEFDVHRNAPVPGVVKALEVFLEEAKSGRIRAISIAGHCEDGGTATAFDTSEGGIAELVLAMERGKLRLLDDTVATIVFEVLGL